MNENPSSVYSNLGSFNNSIMDELLLLFLYSY